MNKKIKNKITMLDIPIIRNFITTLFGVGLFLVLATVFFLFPVITISIFQYVSYGIIGLFFAFAVIPLSLIRIAIYVFSINRRLRARVLPLSEDDLADLNITTLQDYTAFLSEVLYLSDSADRSILYRGKDVYLTKRQKKEVHRKLRELAMAYLTEKGEAVESPYDIGFGYSKGTDDLEDYTKITDTLYLYEYSCDDDSKEYDFVITLK